MTDSPRVASLLPSATEIIFELGLGDTLVAVSDDCDYPPAVKDLPSLTTSQLDDNLQSREIDREVKERRHAGRSLYHLDEQRLEALEPDLVLTQEQCEVCAPAFDDVRESCRVLEGDPTVISLDAHTLSDIFDNILTVAERTGVSERGQEVIGGLRSRTDALTVPDEGIEETRVLTLEWLDPFFVGGHWVPEMVRRLGGESFREPGEPSVEVTAESLREYAPDVTVFMPCGFGLDRTVREGRDLLESLGEETARELFGESIYAVDGSSYFSRSGPRVVTGLKILGSILRPEVVDETLLPDNGVEKLA